MVAEEIKPKEALDLIRHATSLEDTHIFASLRYADWVCHTLESPDKGSKDYEYFFDHLDSAYVSLEKISLFNGEFTKHYLYCTV